MTETRSRSRKDGDDNATSDPQVTDPQEPTTTDPAVTEPATTEQDTKAKAPAHVPTAFFRPAVGRKHDAKLTSHDQVAYVLRVKDSPWIQKFPVTYRTLLVNGEPLGFKVGDVITLFHETKKWWGDWIVEAIVTRTQGSENVTVEGTIPVENASTGAGPKTGRWDFVRLPEPQTEQPSEASSEQEPATAAA